MSLIFLAFQCSIIAFVYSEILIQGDMILNGWYKFLEKRIGKYPFIFKPAVDCAKCVSGQMALWVYLVKCWGGYDLIDHIFTVSLSIFLAIALKAAYNKLLSMSF